MTSAIRSCVACGAPFSRNGRNPDRRFCSARCRARAWRLHHRAEDLPDAPAPGGTGLAGTDPCGLGSAATCPHCHKPITVINIVVPGDTG